MLYFPSVTWKSWLKVCTHSSLQWGALNNLEIKEIIISLWDQQCRAALHGERPTVLLFQAETRAVLEKTVEGQVMTGGIDSPFIKFKGGRWLLIGGRQTLGHIQALWAKDAFPTLWMVESCQVNCSTGNTDCSLPLSCWTHYVMCYYVTEGTVLSAKTESWKTEPLAAHWLCSLSVSDMWCHFEGWPSHHLSGEWGSDQRAASLGPFSLLLSRELMLTELQQQNPSRKMSKAK